MLLDPTILALACSQRTRDPVTFPVSNAHSLTFLHRGFCPNTEGSGSHSRDAGVLPATFHAADSMQDIAQGVAGETKHHFIKVIGNSTNAAEGTLINGIAQSDTPPLLPYFRWKLFWLDEPSCCNRHAALLHPLGWVG